MLAKVLSSALHGIDAITVEVEVVEARPPVKPVPPEEPPEAKVAP